MASKRYKATERGYIDGLGLIEPGQEFSFDGPKGTWMAEIPTVQEKPEPDPGPGDEDEPKGPKAGGKGKGK